MDETSLHELVGVRYDSVIRPSEDVDCLMPRKWPSGLVCVHRWANQATSASQYDKH